MSEKQDGPLVERQKYEAPQLIDLGETARGIGGGACRLGSSPSGTPCLSGGSAQALCTLGMAIL